MEGAKVGQPLGLGSRFLCGDGNGAAEADATAVDMVYVGKATNVRWRTESSNEFSMDGVVIKKTRTEFL